MPDHLPRLRVEAGGRFVRLAIAFLIAPLATGGAIWLTFTALWLLGWHFFVFPHEPYQRVVQDATIVSRLAIEIAGVVTLVGGVPAYWLFRRMRWLRLEHFAVLGVVLGWVPPTRWPGIGSHCRCWESSVGWRHLLRSG
jgi:hypothetical protein